MSLKTLAEIIAGLPEAEQEQINDRLEGLKIEARLAATPALDLAVISAAHTLLVALDNTEEADYTEAIQHAMEALRDAFIARIAGGPVTRVG